MTSEVGICNAALTHLAASTITTLTDGTPNANACNERYDASRDQLLRMHPWNFGTARVKLAKLSTSPVYQWENAFQLPTDCLRVLAVHNNDDGVGNTRYSIEGRKVLADDDEIWLTYTKRVEDPNEFSADFIEVLSHMLAWKIARRVTNSNTAASEQREEFRFMFAKATGTDAVENYPEEFPASSWDSYRSL